MEERLVRYAQLRPCTTAFVDARTPGSQDKENFTIIGPGVAENPEQHVHITIPHGFNIGGARQPPKCVNSQHSHETAEVFIVHTGRWRFRTGHDSKGPSVDLGPGDTISLPVRVFRGFENIGDDTGFMFAVLGGDRPGRVTWAPSVFVEAARYGMVLLEDGRLVDTTKEAIPSGAQRMQPTSLDDVSGMKTLTPPELAACVARGADLAAGGGLTNAGGIAECPVIGVASPAESMAAGPLGWLHGFKVHVLRIEAGSRSVRHSRDEEEVLLIHAGNPWIEWEHGRIVMGPGDTLTVPKGLMRTFGNDSGATAVAYVVRGADHPGAVRQSR